MGPYVDLESNCKTEDPSFTECCIACKMGILTNPDDCSRMVNLLPSQYSQNSFVKCCYGDDEPHSLIRGVLIQSCSAGAKNFTNYVFCHPQFSGVIQNIENHCAILTPVCLCQLLSK